MIVLALLWIAIGHSFWILALHHLNVNPYVGKQSDLFWIAVLILIVCWILGPITYLVHFYLNPFREVKR